jgi:phospholipase C
VPVLSAIAKGFGVFDRWFCEVPSQTFMNRSFWTAATSSGFVINSPVSNWTQRNTAETLFDRLEAHGRTWKVYVHEPMPLSFTGLIHLPRVKDRLATNFVPYSEFERDAVNGTLPDFSLIEPNMLSGHSDYHPALGRSLIPDNMNIPMDPRHRSAAARRSWPASTTRSDRPRPRTALTRTTRCSSSDGMSPAGRMTTWVPAIIVSPWVDEGIVINDEHRHTSMIATLRNVWGLGDPFTGRDAAAATFDHPLSRETPRDPVSWPDVEARPVPQFHMDMVQMGKALSVLGKTAGSGILEHAKQSGLVIPAELTDPNSSPEQVVAALRSIALQVFPRLASHTQNAMCCWLNGRALSYNSEPEPSPMDTLTPLGTTTRPPLPPCRSGAD